ncbi:MAG: hypothetical protein ACTSUE_11270 [Promethearchaeota archaeon]
MERKGEKKGEGKKKERMGAFHTTEQDNDGDAVLHMSRSTDSVDTAMSSGSEFEEEEEEAVVVVVEEVVKKVVKVETIGIKVNPRSRRCRVLTPERLKAALCIEEWNRMDTESKGGHASRRLKREFLEVYTDFQIKVGQCPGFRSVAMRYLAKGFEENTGKSVIDGMLPMFEGEVV